jgi:branched-chain amino acid aminotransferase
LDYISINGKITVANDARTPIDNGAIRYGYGLFETMLVHNGAIRLAEYHWDRLFHGLQQLHLNIPILKRGSIAAEVMQLVRKNNAESLCRVRLQAYAGGGGLYSHDGKGGYIIECFPLEESTLALNDNGLVAGIAQGIKKSIDGLSNIKSCNALIYAMAAKQAMQQKWNDALVSNTNGNIIESTIANIFWVKDNAVFTPPLSEGCVAGVMRRHIMHAIGMVTEQPLTDVILMDADEVFLTNAIKGIRWVSTIENKRFASNKVKEIHAAILKGMVL